jgi:hypothetical protein
VPANGTANLQPFKKGDPRAIEAGRKGGQARRVRAELVRAETQKVAQHVATLATTFDREHLGPAAAAVAMELIGRVSRGEIPVRHAGDAAELVKVLVDVARLEAGESTSNAVVAHVTSEQLDRVRALQAQARTALASTALAVADVVEVEVVDAPTEVDEAVGESTPTPG